MTGDEIPAALSDERDWWLRRLLAAERAAWRAGYAAGDRAGYERGARLLDAEQPAIVRPLLGPSYAEAEAQRWELRGERRTRETFGQPHPADRYPRREAS